MKKNELKKVLICAVIGAVVAFAVMFFFKRNPIIVSGVSMEPTYSDGHILFCTTDFTEKELTRGTIVVMVPSTKDKPEQVVKRIVGIPGDTLWIKDGILYVNGKESEFQFENIQSPGTIASALTLEADHYFCMGDNRNHSIDCRDYGPVHISRIKYVAEFYK